MARRPATRSPRGAAKRTPRRVGPRGARGAAASPPRRFSLDEAFIALFIAAMGANHHVSREELARAHHIIWSMRRFRRKPGELVGRLIDRMRTVVETDGPRPVIAAAAAAIPPRLRPAAFALAADLTLADGKLERTERRFLLELGDKLALDRDRAALLLDAILVKNSA